jgi:hypothetical protein
LSTVQAWDTAHLTIAAQDWTRRATAWEWAFTDVYREMPNPGGASWSGAAAEAALLRAHSDRAKVLAVVDRLQDAAASARSGALELDGAKQRVLSAVNSAQVAGYVVTEDFRWAIRAAPVHLLKPLSVRCRRRRWPPISVLGQAHSRLSTARWRPISPPRRRASVTVFGFTGYAAAQDVWQMCEDPLRALNTNNIVIVEIDAPSAPAGVGSQR